MASFVDPRLALSSTARFGFLVLGRRDWCWQSFLPHWEFYYNGKKKKITADKIPDNMFAMFL